VDLAGPITCHLYLSATAADADVFIALWALGPDGQAVQYGMASTADSPLTRGCLKASQRALDPLRSTVHRPFHLHSPEAVKPLRLHEVIDLDVELMQTASRLQAGTRIRIDVQPVEGAGGFADPTNRGAEQFARAYDVRYHGGHRNAIHTGPATLAYVELPALGPVAFIAGGDSVDTCVAAQTRSG
jgi:predicted acyl esterase